MTAGHRAPPAAIPAARILRRELLLPFIAGGLCVFGFAPFYAWPVPIAALAYLFHVWARSGTPLQASLSGFAFGLGYFLVGVSWVYVSLHEFGSMPAPIAALATFLFCAYLAVFPAASGWAVARFGGARPVGRLLVAPAAFVAFEWLRGWLFTGFPWQSIGTSQAPSSPLAGFAPIAGVYGIGLAAAGAASLAAALSTTRAWSRERYALAGAFAILAVTGGMLRLVSWTAPAGPAVSIALLQGNVPQALKFREEVRARILDGYRQMVFAASARIVVLPETALPAFLDQLPEGYVASLAEHARREGKVVLLGAVEREIRPGSYEYYNSVVRLGEGAMAAYRKRHLVPFGEFIPPGFKWILAVLQIPLSDFARGGTGQAPIAAAGIPFGVAICYEDIFGEEVIDALPQAQALLNVSNDAWFGESFAAEQHLQHSQLRAMETGRWMMRSTNTGITAAIDPTGRVAARLAAFTSGTLVTSVTPYSGTTPYVRFGNLPALALCAVLFALGFRLGAPD